MDIHITFIEGTVYSFTDQTKAYIGRAWVFHVFHIPPINAIFWSFVCVDSDGKKSLNEELCQGSQTRENRNSQGTEDWL